MVVARVLVLFVAFMAAVPLAGCLEPYRVHVRTSVLEGSIHDWTLDKKGLHSDGWLGPKSRETLYSFSPASAQQPPYPAVLQVFSLRELDRRSTNALLGWTEDVVDQAVQRYNIVIDHRLDDEGRRSLDNGVETSWFIHQGRVASEGEVFPEDVTVRIVGEVGHDGRSDTSFVAVGLAQIDRSLQCPIIGPCQNQVDLSTWIEVVGDPDGTIGGATSQNGFLFHLVTS
jgi:hypothetical protein